MKFAITTEDFQMISVDWNENNTYIQSAAIVSDLGVFPNPDKFFEHYTQHWCKMKDFIYVHFGRKIMNYNVGKMRKSHVKSKEKISYRQKNIWINIFCDCFIWQCLFIWM